MKLWSDSFDDGQLMPLQFTGDSSDFSPALEWDNGPKDPKSYAIICETQDAPGEQRTHWMVYGVPGVVFRLAAKIPHMAKHPSGLKQGTNDMGSLGYNGPNHGKGLQTYAFTIYALDIVPKLDGGASREELENAMKGHILDFATTTGTYEG